MTSNKRPSIKLSLFINNLSESFSPSDHSSKSPNSTKSPRIFEPGLVGLGIVAAMNQTSHTQDLFSSSKTTRVAKLSAASKSDPIPIVFAKPKDPVLEKDDENYTCVISHLGNSVKKREYFDVADALDRNSGPRGVFFTSPLKNPQPPAALFDAVDFLSNCYLCRRKLRGLDIFMYRGDKAFCSAECRCQQILSDERRAKCGSGALKSFDCSISPCSAPSIFTAGVAAA